MASSLSSKKRIKQNEARRTLNRSRKGALKKEVRRYLDAVGAGDVATADERLRQVVKALDQTAAKGTLHRNAAARRKSRLAKRLHALKTAKS